ncbi:MFS transporter [Streptomyces canus]|nr:MFS transporter [Streptomyces canus]WSD91714.1 MFS transporter [Streptomyces canus]
MQQTLHVSGPQLSWINAAFLVPNATLGLTFGVLGDIYGRKRVLVGGAALMAIGYAVAPIGVSVHALYVGQALSGIGAAALFASSLASITAATPGAAERARGLAAWTTALSVGALVAPVMSGAVVEFTSFRWTFVAVGLFAVISNHGFLVTALACLVAAAISGLFCAAVAVQTWPSPCPEQCRAHRAAVLGGHDPSADRRRAGAWARRIAGETGQRLSATVEQ